MINQQQYESSQQAIARMLDRIDERYGNAICGVYPMDFDTATQADYINGIDANMVDCTGNSHKLQFKSRMDSTDICIELAIVPHATDLSYYHKKYGKHFVVDTKAAEIFVQELADGTTFIYEALQLHVMAQYINFWLNPIYPNKEGQYLLFVPKAKFREMLLQTCTNKAVG